MKTNEGELRIERGTVLKYFGKDEELKLPRDVVRIAPYAFADNKSLKKIVTPIKLKSIGKGAFYGCSNLVEVTLPGNLYRRVNGGKVFPKDADIYFRFYVSAGEQSEDADYSDEFATEADYINSGVNDAERAFVDEVQSEEIFTIVEELPPEPPQPEEELDDLDNRTLEERMSDIIPADPLQQTDGLNRNSFVNLADFIIVDDEVVKYIGTSRVTTVPNFITKIGENAFSNSEVERVNLPPNLKLIGKNSFTWCENLKEIIIPDSVQMIDDGAFSNCNGMESVKFPSSLIFIGANAFRACSALKEIDLPAGLQTLSRRAFDFCVSVEKVVVPQGVNRIAEGVFSHCESLRKVTLPDGISEICAWAFAECYSLREINFPEGLTEIAEVAFINCRSLVAFDLPHSLKSVGRQAFVGCTSLHLVNMPKRLEKQLRPTKAFHKLPDLSISFYDEDE